MGASVVRSLGVVLCTATVSQHRRRDGGEGAKTDRRSEATVRRWGIGSPELPVQVDNLHLRGSREARANQEHTQVENPCYAITG